MGDNKQVFVCWNMYKEQRMRDIFITTVRHINYGQVILDNLFKYDFVLICMYLEIENQVKI